MDFYTHLSTCDLLRERYLLKKAKNSSFSIRAWANQMGLSSHGGLQQIMAGKRSIPKKYIPRIVHSLGLDGNQAMYLETLVDFEKAKTAEEKDIYHKRLTSLRPNRQEVQCLELENFKYFQNPLHSIIGVMLERSDFKNDPKWIKNHLRVKSTCREVEEVLQRLIALGIVSSNAEGKLKRNYQHVKNKVDIPSQAVQEYHQKMSMMASEEVKKQPVEEREYNSISLNLDSKRFGEARDRIRGFVDEFMSEFGTSQGDQTYQINVQLFSLTKEGDI